MCQLHWVGNTSIFLKHAPGCVWVGHGGVVPVPSCIPLLHCLGASGEQTEFLQTMSHTKPFVCLSVSVK